MRLSLAWFLAVSLVTVVGPGAAGAAAPADGLVIWESTRAEGRGEVYRARADGSEVIRLTRNTGHRPMWSPDGRWISYYEDSGAAFLMRPDGSAVKMLSPAAIPVFWQHDNGGLVLSEGGQYWLVDPDSGERTELWKASDFPVFSGTTFQPSAMTHDNRYLLVGSHLYLNGHTGANGSFKTGFSAVIVDLLARDKVYFFGNGCWPFTPPEGSLVYHVCGDGSCPAYPDIMRLDLTDLDTRASYQAEISHPDPDWGHEYNPRVSTDGKWIVYMTSTGCHDGYVCDYEVFLHKVGAGPGDRQRVTESPTFDGYPEMYVGPAWSPPAEPRLLLTPNRFTVYAGASSLPATRTLKVKNGGAGALGPVSALVQPPVPWLQAEISGDVNGGVGGGLLTLRLMASAGITRGRQEGRVLITAGGIPAVTVPVVVMGDDSLPAATAPPEAGDGGAGAGDANQADGATASDAAAGTGRAGGDGCDCSLGDAPARGDRWAAAGLLLIAAALSRRRPRRSPPRRSPGCTPPPPLAARHWR
jgi:MYXO-CTERM domain-containing protein